MSNQETQLLAVESRVSPRAPAVHNKSIMMRANQKEHSNDSLLPSVAKYVFYDTGLNILLQAKYEINVLSYYGSLDII